MSKLEIIRSVLTNRCSPFWGFLAAKQRRAGRLIGLFFACIILTTVLLPGCSHFNDGYQAESTYEAANKLFCLGCYQASLEKYEQIIKKYPAAGDRVLFEMGIIYSHPKNERKDYQKALECFQRLIREYPASEYRQNSQSMIFSINNVALKDKMIATQQTQLENLQKELKNNENEIATLQKKNKALKQQVFSYVLQKGSIDRILIEKKARRLMLLSNGEVLKTYKIALGGNPVGPKEREGDDKTPEGIYCIDSRNNDSQYHRALHISYPNEKDRKRAQELGVPPGGDIMIHGLKNGFSWVGTAQSEVDWTKGCIAVTDEEIDEIDKLTPNGTIVEIRP